MPAQRPIRFITTPAFGEVKEHVRAELLAVALTRRLGHPVTIETAATFEEVMQALESGEVDVVWGTADLCDRFEPEARAVLRAVRAGSCAYHAALICRADEPLTLDRMDGTTVAWITRWSTAGYLLPRAHLKENGIDPDQTFATQLEVGSYRRALLAVLEGDADVTSIYCKQPDERAVRVALTEHIGSRESELVPFAFTRSSPADGIIITQRLDTALADRLIDALVELGSGASGVLHHLGLFDTEGFALDGHVVTPSGDGAGRDPQVEDDALQIFEVTSDGICQRAWTQSGRIAGRSCAQAVGQPLSDVLNPAWAAPVCALVSEAFRNGTGGRIEFKIGEEDALRWFSAEFTLASDDNERDAAALLVREVTEKRTIEDALYHLASYPLLMPEPVLEIDRDGALLYANRAAHHHFPGLVAQGADHPVIAAMLAVNRSANVERRSVLREVELDGRLWKISVLSPADADFIRAAVVDMSEVTSPRHRQAGDPLQLIPRRTSS